MSRSRDVRDLAGLDAVFEALAHPVRREIVQALHARNGEMLAGDLAARFEHSWPTTTRHLAVLVDSELIGVRKNGRERLYTLRRERLVAGLGLWLHNVDIAIIDKRRGG